jgi:hypothetical protein
MSGDFEGDRSCSTHFGCTCLQRKAAERDRLQADLSALRRGLEREIDAAKKRAFEADDPHSTIAHYYAADRLLALLGGHDG